MALLFQYGSNTSIARLNSEARLAGAAQRLGIAHTETEYEFDFTVWSEENGCAAADLVPGGGRRIWGVLYDVPDPLIRRETAGGRRSMDAIECEGKHYRRTTIPLRDPAGETLEAITYLVLDPVWGLPTSTDYVNHVLRGLHENRVPADYLAYVESRIVANNPALSGELQQLAGGLALATGLPDDAAP